MNSAAELLRNNSGLIGRDGLAGAEARAEAVPLRTVIERRPSLQVVDPGELWRYRELLFFLAWRDIKVRYKQTALGASWAVLQPLATMAAFCLFLREAASPDASSVPYPLFVFAGMLPWTFFANAIGSAGQSVVANQNLVTKVYFPRLMLPLSTVVAGLVDFAVAGAMMPAMMFYYGVAPGRGILWAPVILAGLAAATTGIGTLLAALTVRYRDFRHVIPLMTQVWMFCTPSIYARGGGMLGTRAQLFLPLNPAYGLILNFRRALLGGPIDSYSLIVSGGVSLLLLFLGAFYFRRAERGFADIV
jgi:lipopolysaccharide transport system permease protein